MATGLNQNVEVLGRTFHVQTEVTSGDNPKLRTTVFVGGRIVGSRETEVSSDDDSDAALREQINAQHAMIVDNLHKRANELQADRERLGLTGSPVPTQKRRATPPAKEVPLPKVDEVPRLAASIRVRQLLGPFSLAFDPLPPSSPAVLRACLETAANHIDELMASPIFPEIRLDEQVRFFDLREHLAGWRGQRRDPELGAEIWKEIVVFCSHLRKISDRRELLAYDHKLLTWALLAAGRSGATPELVDQLRNLYGRDAALDRVIDRPNEIDGHSLLEILMGLLDQTVPESL